MDAKVEGQMLDRRGIVGGELGRFVGIDVVKHSKEGTGGQIREQDLTGLGRMLYKGELLEERSKVVATAGASEQDCLVPCALSCLSNLET